MAPKTIERRVSDLEEMFEDVPRLINLRFSYVRAQLDALDARSASTDAKVDNLRTEVQSLKAELQNVKAEVQAMPRILAEMLDERAKRGQ